MAVKRIYIGVLMLFCMITISGTDYRQSIQVNDIEITHTGKEVTVKFSLHAGTKAVKSDYALVISPVLKNQTDSISLPEITIWGSRAYIAETRNLLAKSQKKKNSFYYTKNGGKVLYSVTAPYQDWMQKSQLVLNGVNIGCCSAKEVKIGIIKDALWDEQNQQALVIPRLQEKTTTGDRLSKYFPFLAPITSLNRTTSPGIPLDLNKDSQTDIESFINSNREGSLIVYFTQGGRIIDQAYKGNYETLVKLVSAIRSVETSTDSRIAYIVIAGFASPEGSLSFNEQLAWDRGIALNRFVAENSSLPSDKIYVYGGSVDWMGLRNLVNISNMYDKYRVLEIIDTPEWNKGNRLNNLMNLSNGVPYRYMLNNFFPLLRNAAYVKVYYENL